MTPAFRCPPLHLVASTTRCLHLEYSSSKLGQIWVTHMHQIDVQVIPLFQSTPFSLPCQELKFHPFTVHLVSVFEYVPIGGKDVAITLHVSASGASLAKEHIWKDPGSTAGEAMVLAFQQACGFSSLLRAKALGQQPPSVPWFIYSLDYSNCICAVAILHALIKQVRDEVSLNPEADGVFLSPLQS